MRGRRPRPAPRTTGPRLAADTRPGGRALAPARLPPVALARLLEGAHQQLVADRTVRGVTVTLAKTPRRLDWKPRFTEASLAYKIEVKAPNFGQPPVSKSWRRQAWLDQGQVLRVRSRRPSRVRAAGPASLQRPRAPDLRREPAPRRMARRGLRRLSVLGAMETEGVELHGRVLVGHHPPGDHHRRRPVRAHADRCPVVHGHVRAGRCRLHQPHRHR
jgi:hypothetical protein